LRQIEGAFRAARRPARPRFPLAVLPDPGGRAAISPDRLTLTLPVPPSVNHQYATVNGRRVLSAMGRGYKDQVARQIMVALAKSVHRADLLQAMRAQDLALTVHFYFTSPLRRDVDGGLKISQDAVCEALGVNDNRIVEIHLFKSLDRARPRIEVSLSCTAPGATDSSR
jgi:crossover junction endodeoxyribonuclease RusA